MKSNKPIMIVDDDRVDSMTISRALKDIHVTNVIIYKQNGEEAAEYLLNESNERPCIILLDLNMPKMNGVEFLKKMKDQDHFKRIPVIVLTTSTEEQDKVNTFDLGVSGYMKKPVDYHQFVEVMKTIDMYWTLSEIPE